MEPEESCSVGALLLIALISKQSALGRELNLSLISIIKQTPDDPFCNVTKQLSDFYRKIEQW